MKEHQMKNLNQSKKVRQKKRGSRLANLEKVSISVSKVFINNVISIF